jgi:alkylhydroperoxidase family enzyme
MNSGLKSFFSFSALMATIGMVSSLQADPVKESRFPLPTNTEAWKNIPRENPPLPNWARMLSRSLPKTTGLMIQLDYVHRVKNPLDPKLRAEIRWMVSQANNCEYTRQYAESDLKRLGMTEEAIKELASNHSSFPEREQKVFAFAKKLTLSGHSITDEEVEELMKHYGPEKLVAIVHTVAHANFQDRIFLALGVEMEEKGPFPPMEMKLDPEAKDNPPKRPELNTIREEKDKSLPSDWLDRDFGKIQQSMSQQKARKTRIPFPELKPDPKNPSKQPTRSKIVWSAISMGYQPLLTRSWFECMSSFENEAKQNQVFSNTVFWIVTRSNECFY